jgi:thymidylate synthase (FAD)
MHQQALSAATAVSAGDEIRVLDHGFIRVVDLMGDDQAIVQAARVSYGRGTKTAREDRGLIRYLMRHWHTSPFEMCEIKLHVKAPLFVARQWLRHRTASVNEYSARYSVVPDEFYVPTGEVLAPQSSDKKQGRADAVSHTAAEFIRKRLKDHVKTSYDLYEALLGGDDTVGGEGVARELARIALPLNTYTEFYWKIDLHNLLHFVRLRAHDHSQYEIRVYAEAILSIMERWVPFTYEAFVDYRLGGAQFSRLELAALRRMLGGETVTAENSGLSQREWREFTSHFALGASAA